MMMNYVDFSDEQLWKLATDGDISAEEQLIERYSKLVRVCARPFFLAGGDSEDLIQEGMIGLLSAIRQYDPERDASFKTYADHCIRNRLLTAIKTASRYKHIPLNEYVSFESPQFDEAQNYTSYLRDPEELLITRERVNEITSDSRGFLSKFELSVLDLYLKGLSYGEIALSLSKSTKSVDNAVQRIRKKLAQYL